MAGRHADRSPLGEQEEKRETAQQGDPRTADLVARQNQGVEAKEVEHQGQEHPPTGADPGQTQGLLGKRHRALRAVEARAEEQAAPEEQNERQERQIGRQLIKAAADGQQLRQQVAPDGVGQDEGPGHQNELEEKKKSRYRARAFLQHVEAALLERSSYLTRRRTAVARRPERRARSKARRRDR